MKYYLIAGEASGDLHGSNLMRGLYAEDPEADIRFWGGGLMNAVFHEHRQGEGLVEDYKEDAVIGFSHVLLHPEKFLRKLKRCREDLLRFAPDAVVLIDYPGFNFKIAKFAHRQGFKVFYYIAPKVWASREGRIRLLKACVDRLFIVFPFEKEYFSAKGVSYVYKGNPLIDAVDRSPAMQEGRDAFFRRNGLEDGPYIALLPGSRKAEIGSMMPVCVDFAEKWRRLPGGERYRFLIAGAPSRPAEDYARFLSGREAFMQVLFGETYGILKHSEAAVVNSGTASLEACLIGTPQVVAYAGSSFNFHLGKQLLRVDFISLGNLILGKKAFKELLQYYFTADNLVSEVRRLVRDEEYRQRMLSDYARIRAELGGAGASLAVARAMTAELAQGR